MLKQEFTYPSADGRTPIHVSLWLPEGTVRGVVQISHGVAEYIDRYAPLAAYLTDRGFAVAGNDHIGHGKSLAPGAPRLYFGPRGSWQHAAADLYALRCRLDSRFPGVPCFLLGHSMGSFLARTYLIRWPGTVRGAILIGTGWMSPAAIAGGRAIAAQEIRRIGEDRISPPSTAPMSIMVPSPMTAPMLITAPIMITAPRPISTFSRMMAPGSIRAGMAFMSSRGTPEFLRSFSTTTSAMAAEFFSRMGPSSDQSPNTIRLFPSPKTLAEPKSTGAVRFT